MSDWTYEKHYLARQASVDVSAHPGGDVCERAADYLDDALDEIERLRADLDELHAEIERLRSLADDEAAVERAVQGMMQADRDRTGFDTEWDADEIAWFERDARAALRAALNSEGGEQA